MTPARAALLSSQSDPDVRRFLDRVGRVGAISRPAQRAVETFVRSAKAKGYWSQFVRLNLCVGDSLAASLVPIVSALGAPDDAVIGTPPTYAEATGWVSSGAGCINTGAFLPATLQLGESVYVPDRPATTGGVDGVWIGARVSPADSRISQFQGSIYVAMPGTNTGPSLGVGSPPHLGLVHVVRGGATVLTGYVRGVQRGFSNAASTAQAFVSPVYVLATSTSNVAASNYHPANHLPAGSGVRGYGIDASMTPSQVVDYAADMQAFQAALGRAV